MFNKHDLSKDRLAVNCINKEDAGVCEDHWKKKQRQGFDKS